MDKPTHTLQEWDRNFNLSSQSVEILRDWGRDREILEGAIHELRLDRIGRKKVVDRLTKRVAELEELEEVALTNRNMLLKRNVILIKENKILDEGLKYFTQGDGWYSSQEAIDARQAAQEVGDGG